MFDKTVALNTFYTSSMYDYTDRHNIIFYEQQYKFFSDSFVINTFIDIEGVSCVSISDYSSNNYVVISLWHLYSQNMWKKT